MDDTERIDYGDRVVVDTGVDPMPLRGTVDGIGVSRGSTVFSVDFDCSPTPFENARFGESYISLEQSVDTDTKRNPHANYPANSTKEPDIPDTRNWHETGTLPCGYRIGKLGALWYVLDGDGWAVSDGYHEISDDGTEGKRGASTERVNLRGQPARSSTESDR